MTQQNPSRGDRTTRAVPPAVLIIGGLLVALVAGIILATQLLGGSDGASPTPTAPTSAAPVDTGPTVDPTEAAPSTEEPARTTGTSTSPTTATGEETGEAGYAIPSSDPAWIRIAAGGVDGGIVPQGLAPDGTINPGRNEIIWFTGNNRVPPGQVGTSVIAAHVTWEGAPDAFANLASVGVGDVVEVGYADGETRSFAVREAMPIDKDALSRSLTVWGDHPDHPRLAIVTCDETQGYGADGHTSANYVLIAEPTP